ncbi:MAG: DUF3108 domain-containing protein [Edaphocola sp.]
MKHIFGIAALALSLLGNTNMVAQNGFCGVANKCLNHGEKLNFKVYYNLGAVWVGAGEANFTTKEEQLNGHPVYHIVGNGATYKSYDWIFKVRDKYETFIDMNTLLPLKFLRSVSEGDYHFTNNVTFDQTAHKAYSDKKIFAVPDCVQDVLSAIFYARNIDYDKYAAGTKIPFGMFLDNEVFGLYIRYHGKETVNTKYGTFRAIKISPLLIKGTIFEGGEKMTIWVSDDANHIPLRVDSPILVGSIKVDMMGCNNLKHPLSSLVKKK